MAGVDYSIYKSLIVDKTTHGEGVCMVTMNNPSTFNSMTIRMHWEVANIWKDLDRDADVRVIVVTGAGKAFSAGGDFSMVEKIMKSDRDLTDVHRDTRDLVHNMINCDKPIIAMVNGLAVGAGMVVAMMSDISIVSKEAKFNDGHIRLGVAAGDHAASILPLLIGMHKSKYFLLTGEFISAEEAYRMDMISMLVEPAELAAQTMKVAKTLAEGPQNAIRYTKRALNQWLRQQNIVSFDLSCAYEMLCFQGDDAKEGMRALKAKQKPKFPSTVRSKL